MKNLIEPLKSIPWKKHKARLREMLQRKPILAGLGVVGLLLLINLLSLVGGGEERIMERGAPVDFQKGRILDDRESSFYYGKERLLSKKAQTMLDEQAKLEARLAEIEKKMQAPSPVAGDQAKAAAPAGPEAAQETASEQPLQLYENQDGQASFRRTAKKKGPDLITFPVKAEPKGAGVVLPAGSYVKAKILTGVDVPEGKTYPVLMVLDFSYVTPNDQKVDLAGCFMIAKAEGDLSTERVQMQATKMSCVSKKGKMFERDVNGFVADDQDGSFAMKGKVNSKQGRVAAMSFMASVVDGVGKAVQAAQTNQSTNAFGGATSALTGDAGKFAVAGGASNAAGMVAQWYLQQAQNLAPTVEVGSGRDVWIVMKEKVALPEEFFKERKAGNAGIYSYFSVVE